VSAAKRRRSPEKKGGKAAEIEEDHFKDLNNLSSEELSDKHDELQKHLEEQTPDCEAAIAFALPSI